MEEMRRKLFDELMVNPEGWVSEWFEHYNHFTKDIQEIRERLQHKAGNLSDYRLYAGLESLSDQTFEGFVWKLVGELKNGIASRGQSVISREHLAQFRKVPQFEEFLREIILNPLDNQLFIKFNEWWVSQPDVRHNRVLINRIFAACAPAELSTLVDEGKFNRLFRWLQDEKIIGRYGPPHSEDTWLLRNIFMTKELRGAIREGFAGEWSSIFPWLLFEYMEDQVKKEEHQKMMSLPIVNAVTTENQEPTFLPFYSGLVLGGGQHEYVVKRISQENIELIRTATAVERFIPVVVIKALCDALDRKDIDFDDLERRQNNGSKGADHVFDKIGLNHDKFIMGYDASIIKLCEYYAAHKEQGAALQVSDMLSGLNLTSLFSTEENASLCSAALAKRFIILTGLSGSGKTLQALSFAKWITPIARARDVFHSGSKIPSSNVTYYVAKSDAMAVEFWNSEDPEVAVKVTLPREMIAEWAEYIRRNNIPKTTQAREIREAVKAVSRFSDQLHSFETHLKAAAWAVLDAGKSDSLASDYEIVSVGADWTSNENLLGYPDALNPGHYRKPDNGALDLILRAQANSDLPYFLILDEMNLSHVERYFADFLSAMESGEAISLHDDTGADWGAEGTIKVPAKLTIPKNLFVIGTVNVDETTYMFSPKVLDRANVIEFRVSDDEMKSFLENPVKPNLKELEGQGAQYAKAFVAAAKQRDVPLDPETREAVSKVLMEFFPQLKEAGAEFGYRTAHEICRFVYFHKDLSSNDWKLEAAMDAAIMQKLLPKLHGARRKLEPILEKLEKLCEKDYPRSLEKIQRMLKRLREHGFTSFAEA
jgi:hypothetical protein